MLAYSAANESIGQWRHACNESGLVAKILKCIYESAYSAGGAKKCGYNERRRRRGAAQSESLQRSVTAKWRQLS